MSENMFVNIQGNADSLRHSLRGVGNSLGNLDRTTARTMGSMTNSFQGLNRIIGIGMMYKFARGMASAVKSALDMIEVNNLFVVSLGNLTEEAMKTVDSLQQVYGLDPTNLKSAIGGFALLSRSMGMTTKQAEVLSTNTTRLALDLSSLTNVPIQQVMQDLRSGLVGQSETVYKYGIDVTEAGLKTEAMNQGITESVRNMSQGEKMALRYATMLRQTTLAQGDFARTINAPANQLRILSERFVTLSRAIGTIFMPMLKVVLPWLNALVMVLTDVANKIASLFGYEAPTNATGLNQVGEDAKNSSDALGGTTKAVDGTTKALKKMKSATLGFDELNILPKPTSPSAGKNAGAGAGLDGGAGGILSGMELPTLGELLGDVPQISDELKKKLLPVLDGILDLVTLIGVGFLAWKLAPSIANMFFGAKALGLASILGKVKDLLFTGGKLTTVRFFSRVAYLPMASILTAISGTLIVMIGRFVDLLKNSENFRNGLKVINDWLADATIEALKFVGAFEFPPLFQKTLGKIGIDFEDLALTILGVALLFTPFGAFGVAILAFEAFTLLVRGVGKLFSPAIESVDVLGEGISDVTNKKMKPFMKAIDDVRSSFTELSFTGEIIDDETLKELKKDVKTVTQIIVDELDADKNEALKNLEPLRDVMSKEDFDQMRRDAENYYEGAKTTVADNEAEILRIITTANEAGVEVSDENLKKIAKLNEESNAIGVTNLVDNNAERMTIMRRMGANTAALTVEEASKVLIEQKKAKEKVIENAENQYSRQLLLATAWYGENGVNNKEAYDAMVLAADENKEAIVESAEKGYEKINKKTREKLGENAKFIDENNNEVLGIWDKFWIKLDGGRSAAQEEQARKNKEANAKMLTGFKEYFKNVGIELEKWRVNSNKELQKWEDKTSLKLAEGWARFMKGWSGFWTELGKGHAESQEEQIEKNNKANAKMLEDFKGYFSDRLTAFEEWRVQSNKDLDKWSEEQSIKIGQWKTRMLLKAEEGWVDFARGWNSTLATMGGWYNDMYQIGVDLLDGLFEGLKPSNWKIYNWGVRFINEFIANLPHWMDRMKLVGKDLLSGLFGGLKPSNWKIWDWGSSLINRLKTRLGIHSPSTVMRDEIGKFMGLGLAIGLGNTTKDIVGTAGRIVDGIKGQFANVNLTPTSDFSATDMALKDIDNKVSTTATMNVDNTDFSKSVYDSVYSAIDNAMKSPDNSQEVVLNVGGSEFGRVAINTINKITKSEGRLALNI